jgi:multiple sugar transport system substrate-binding protein
MVKITRKLVLILLLVGVLSVACRDNGENSIAEKVTVRFAIPNYQQTIYEELVKAFEKENPDIHIELVFEDEILQQGSSSGVATVSSEDDLKIATAADVFTPIDIRYASEQGAVLDLTPFIEADTQFDTADFYPGMLEQVQWNGRTWAVPYEAALTLIYFNKDLFDAAGIAYPKPGWTWDDFLDAAMATTHQQDGQTVQWGFLDTFFQPLFFIQGRTGPLFDLEAEPPTARLEETAVVNTVRWYTDLFRVHQVTAQLPYLDTDTLIANGQVGMWAGLISRNEQLRPVMNLGVVPFPVDAPDDRSTPVSFVRAFAISAGTAHPDAAWRWLDFISRQIGDWSNFGGPSQIPARRSVTEASNFWKLINEELATALRYAVDHAFVPVRARGFSQAVEAILSGEKSVEAALAEAQPIVEAAMAAQQAERAQATPAPPIVMNPPDEEPAASDDVTTITFRANSQLSAFRALADEFHAAHPDIVVEVLTIDFDEQTNLPGLAAESDCFQWSPGFDDSVKTAVLSLEPFFATDASLNQSDFYPSAIEQFTYQGELYGLPAEIGVSLIAFNKDLFDAAGVAYPTPGWTTDDFLATAVSLTQGEGETKQYGYVADLYEPNDFLDFLAQLAGSNLIDETAVPATLNFTDPAVVAATSWFTDLTTSYGVKPVFLTNPNDSDGMTEYQAREALINNGRAAMWSESGQFAGGISIVVTGSAAARPANIGYVPLPAAPDGSRHGGYQAVSGYFISAAADAPQACWQWLTFLSTQPTLSTQLPARQETAQSAAYRQHVGPELADAYLFTIEDATSPSLYQLFATYPWLGAANFWLAEAYDQIVGESVSVNVALTQAQDQAEAFQACITANEGLNDFQKQQNCFVTLP